MNEANKIKILFVIPWLKLGGAERFLLNLLRLIDKDRFEPVLVCVRKVAENRQWQSDLDDWGVKLIELDKQGKLDIKPLFQLIRLIRREKPDIVHTQLFLGDIMGRVAGRLAGVKVIVSGERNLNLSEGRLKSFLKRLTAPLVTLFVPISAAVRDYIIKKEGARAGKCRIIPTGVDPDKFFYRRDYISPLIRIGSVGRLTEQKGFDTLIRAMALLPEEGVDCRIAGQGELYSQLSGLINELGLQKKVRLVGWQTDPRKFYQDIDIFVLPSNWEGMGTVVLEAGLSGLPVVASRVDGIREVIRHRENGYLFTPGKHQDLAKKLTDLLKSPEERARLGQNLQKEIMADFDIRKIIKQYENLYIELLRG